MLIRRTIFIVLLALVLCPLITYVFQQGPFITAHLRMTGLISSLPLMVWCSRCGKMEPFLSILGVIAITFGLILSICLPFTGLFKLYHYRRRREFLFKLCHPELAEGSAPDDLHGIETANIREN